MELVLNYSEGTEHLNLLKLSKLFEIGDRHERSDRHGKVVYKNGDKVA